MAIVPDPSTSASEPQPAWDIALLYPYQGEWRDSDYLDLGTNHLVELVDGKLEVLPMPTFSHQLIVAFLFEILKKFVKERQLGAVVFAPMPVQIRDKTYREPDVMFFSNEQKMQPGDKYSRGAGLVMEVVSADDKSYKRDYKDKRADYAEAGIAEYWIVDPQQQRIVVLALDGRQYRVHGEFVPGQQATSVLLTDFAVEVLDVVAAGQNLS